MTEADKCVSTKQKEEMNQFPQGKFS